MPNDAKRFRARLQKEVLHHPIIEANAYTEWFRRGEFSTAQARAFVIQFSVFSNEFLVAQLRKMLNAESMAEMRQSKEILANEIGVCFNGKGGAEHSELGDTSGSIDGGTFRFRAAHFELLVRIAKGLELQFEDLGKRRFGTAQTLHFCNELVRLYGHEDFAVAEAASWAVENWAANHAQHTWDELEQWYALRDVDEDAFIKHAREMLDAVTVFWSGLDAQRREIAAETTLVPKLERIGERRHYEQTLRTQSGSPQ